MFRKILVPLDGSTFAEQALATAAMVAAHSLGSTATIELLMVDTNAMRSELLDGHGDASERVYVNGIAEEASRLLGVPVSGIVIDGDPATVIVERAHDIGADLIVMSTHGRTGLTRTLLGSVADSVARDAGRPVLLHRPTKDARWRTAVPRAFQRVLVPLADTEAATAILAPALDLCRWMEARPVLCRVIHPVVELTFSEAGVPSVGIIDEDATRFAVDLAQSELTELALDIEADTRIPVQTSVEVGGDVSAALLEVARRTNADLIALFTHGRGATRILVESVTDRLLRHSQLPLLLLHPASSPAVAREHAHA